MGCCKKNKCGCGFPFYGNPVLLALNGQTITNATLTNGVFTFTYPANLLGACTFTTAAIQGAEGSGTQTITLTNYNATTGTFTVTYDGEAFTNVAITTNCPYPYYGGYGYDNCCKKKKKCCKKDKCCGYGYGYNNYYGYNGYYGGCGGYGYNNYGYGCGCGGYYGGYY